MKTEIRNMGGFFRVYYTVPEYGETSVPFDTEAEANAFERGLKHYRDATETVERRRAWKEKRLLGS